MEIKNQITNWKPTFILAIIVFIVIGIIQYTKRKSLKKEKGSNGSQS